MIGNLITGKIVEYSTVPAILGISSTRFNSGNIGAYLTNPLMADILMVEDTPCGADEIYDADNLVLTDEKLWRKVIPVPPITSEVTIPKIWGAAHDYEYALISGSAIGMLALGVERGLPKSLAVQVWVSAIWTQYYTNKALLESGAPYIVAMIDYSSHGTIPHTVPELRVEVGV